MARTVFDVAIVGGGASGMMAAIAASTALGPDGKVIILEAGPRVGRKLLASGNGRCNFSNARVQADSYNNAGFVAGVFQICPPGYILELFERLGLMISEEEGRLYPLSEASSSMLDILRLKLAENKVSLALGFSVESIKKDKVFNIKSREDAVIAKTAILASGGKASPSLGSDGSGFALARSLGHGLSDLSPGLTGFKCERDMLKSLGLPALNGLRVSASASLLQERKIVAREHGSVLFREYGLSGVAIFNLSRYKGDLILLDLLPGYSEEALRARLSQRASRLSGRPLDDFFTGMFHRVVGAQLMKAAGLDAKGRRCDRLTSDELRGLASIIKNWAFPVEGVLGWQNAQITLGGLDVEEFEPGTLESRVIAGLYACGEVLDIDGPCGGYNLCWAWSSGFVAGSSAAEAAKATAISSLKY